MTRATQQKDKSGLGPQWLCGSAVVPPGCPTPPFPQGLRRTPQRPYTELSVTASEQT